MKKQIGKITGGLLIAGLLVTGTSTGLTAYAANTDTGAAGVTADTKYSVEEMLIYAIEDEYLAQAEYKVIMDTFGVQKPFSQIVKAEAKHISLLEPLLEENNVALPTKDWESLVEVPKTLEEAYASGIEAEKNNIAMYEGFLKEDLPADVKEVFEKLSNGSEKHLVAFQRNADGRVDGKNTEEKGKRLGNKQGSKQGSKQGNRQGNRQENNQNKPQEDCLFN